MPPCLSKLYLYISSYVCLDLSVNKISVLFCTISYLILLISVAPCLHKRSRKFYKFKCQPFEFNNSNSVVLLKGIALFNLIFGVISFSFPISFVKCKYFCLVVFTFC